MDFIAKAVELRDAVKALRTPPASSGGKNALKNAWNAILNQNYQAMDWQADLNDLSKAANWQRDAAGKVVHLKPHRWGMATGHLGDCYLGLAVALSRYLGFRWVWAPNVIKVGKIGSIDSIIGSKAAVTAAKAAQDAAHAKEMENMEALYKGIATAVNASLEATRKELLRLREEVRDLLDAMQTAESKRLAASVAANAGLTPPEQQAAKDLLAEMRDLQTDFENFDGAPSQGVTLLGKWKHRREKVETLAAKA